MEKTQPENVLPFQKKSDYALFSPSVRKVMIEAIGTEEAPAEVDRIENALCQKAVAEVRSLGERLGDYIANKVISFFQGA